MKRIILFSAVFLFLSKIYAVDLSTDCIHITSDSEGSCDAFSIGFYHKTESQNSELLFGGSYSDLKSNVSFFKSEISAGNFIYSVITPSVKFNFGTCFADSEKINFKFPCYKSLTDFLNESGNGILAGNFQNGMPVTLHDYSSNNILFEIPLDISFCCLTPFCMFSNFTVNDADLFFIRGKIRTEKNITSGIKLNLEKHELEFSYTDLKLVLENRLNEIQISGNAGIFSIDYNYSFFNTDKSLLKAGMNYLLFDERCNGNESFVEAGIRFLLMKLNIGINAIAIDQKMKCSLLNQNINWKVDFKHFVLSIDLKNFFVLGSSDLFKVEDDSDEKYISLEENNAISKKISYSGIILADIDSTFYISFKKECHAWFK